VRAYRLFDEDVASFFERAPRGARMRLDGRCNDDEVRRRDARAFVVKTGDAPGAGDFFRDGAVCVEHASELEIVGQAANDARVAPSHRPDADHHDAAWAARRREGSKRAVEYGSCHSEERFTGRREDAKITHIVEFSASRLSHRLVNRTLDAPSICLECSF